MNRIMRIFLTLGTVYLSVCLVLFPKEGVAVARDALTLCANTVIPTLFPYLVCSGFLSASGIAAAFSRYLSPVMKPLFGVPGSGTIALVLGTVSGYPIGAVCASDLYSSGECTKSDAEKLLAFCNNSGPLFIMSVIGCGYLGSPHLGRLLYISHVMSAILVGIILRTYNPKSCFTPKTLPKPISLGTKNTLRIFGSVMDNSVFSILKICGFVVFFTVFAAALPKSPLSPYIHSLLEITGGVKVLITQNISFDAKMCLISFFIAFSGISILFQVGAIAAKHGLSLKLYFVGKLLQGLFSAVLTKIMVSKLPRTIDVFADGTPIQVGLVPSVFMLGFGIAVLAVMLFAAKLIRDGK